MIFFESTELKYSEEREKERVGLYYAKCVERTGRALQSKRE